MVSSSPKEDYVRAAEGLFRVCLGMIEEVYIYIEAVIRALNPAVCRMIALLACFRFYVHVSPHPCSGVVRC